jgi:hypothetical protein
VVGSRGVFSGADVRPLMSQEGDVRGVHIQKASGAELKEIHSAIAAGLADRTLQPVVTENTTNGECPYRDC